MVMDRESYSEYLQSIEDLCLHYTIQQIVKETTSRRLRIFFTFNWNRLVNYSVQVHYYCWMNHELTDRRRGESLKRYGCICGIIKKNWISIYQAMTKESIHVVYAFASYQKYVRFLSSVCSMVFVWDMLIVKVL